MKRRYVPLFVLLAVGAVACHGHGTAGAGGKATASGASASSGTGGGGGTGGMAAACYPAAGTAVSGTNTWMDGTSIATVTPDNPASCARTYTLYSTAPLRDGMPTNPRIFSEKQGQPVVRTNNDMFDALSALAIDDARQNSVDSISDGSFNGGMPLPCPAGGCFETGQKWTYVWTRDTSYSTDLGLAALDPTRTKNSLLFKVSPHRDGTRPEIVQDTGTGGSWPISSDRVVWAMGAWELLKYLDGADRTAFRDTAHEALMNTVEHDRAVVYDSATGLYHGEQSFLDWREQTYPAFVATDTVQIAMSESLSTNLVHLRALEILQALATEKGDTAATEKYKGWADSLRTAIPAKLWLSDRHLFSTFLPSTLDEAPATRFDLLGSALAVLSDALTPQQAADVVATYPHFAKGAPVIFPEQQDTPIYHNRAMWPFVTAYWARAAAQVKNADVFDSAVRSLMRGAAMNLSNMENFEATSGANWVSEGPTSGPVVDSDRQLWSFAGYTAMTFGLVFGRELSQSGIRFSPKITTGLRSTLFAGADVLSLSNLSYKGKVLSVRVHLPPNASGSPNGFFDVASVKLNGAEVGADFIDAGAIPPVALFDVTLTAGTPSDRTITMIDPATVTDYKNVFGPHTPTITGLSIVNDRVSIAWDPAGETDVTFDVYRDGARVASALPAGTTSYVDMASGDHATTTHCYSVDSVFTKSQNVSQHSRAMCDWGVTTDRIQTFGAQGFTATGGVLSQSHGQWHYDDWGNPGDTLTVANIVPTHSGKHLLQVSAGNGAGGFTTGITCGEKTLEVWDGSTLVTSGPLIMPQLGTWDAFSDSNFVPVTLTAGKIYTVVIREDATSGNMSDFSHFALYGGTGGVGGRFDKVNISQLKLLALGVP